MTAINLAQKLSGFADHWQPRTVGVFNGHDLSERSVTLGPGEMFVVPKDVEYCPVAEEEVHMLVIEPTGTPNSGDPKTAAPRRVI